MARIRHLERECQSLDELARLNAEHERAGIAQRHLTAKAAVITAQRAHDEAHEAATRPWREYWEQQRKTAALTFLEWLEREALPANEAMLHAQEVCAAAGVRVEALHVPHLLREAVAHRVKVGRQGLGLGGV